MEVLDLFAGLGGFSAGFRERGHSVTTLDNDPSFNCTYTMDIKNYQPHTLFDVVLASPPCQEFARLYMPWKRKLLPAGFMPDMSLVLEAIRIIKEVGPRYWCLENVVGSRKFIEPLLGKYAKKVGSRYLWGKFPPFDTRKNAHGKEKLWPKKDRPAIRSLIPLSLSRALCIAIEYDMGLIL